MSVNVIDQLTQEKIDNIKSDIESAVELLNKKIADAKVNLITAYPKADDHPTTDCYIVKMRYSINL
ncbi:hypothetical protein SAMN05444285_1612 [Draconibacterium orientale]|uniref:Uncharacterized protein n=1 Tax=Draconibacterium orientale TaxID=1168034 RepID=X5DLU9_9BACT|nr:hypothetical protein FH5T_03635 [Draconibacterium orientale]SEU15563.1 hypothetical protein SAMN05444285_1612 [Draconibacterium orientale]